jgi:hypothetical protein
MAGVKELWYRLVHGTPKSPSRGPTLVPMCGGLMTSNPKPPDLRSARLELMEAQRLLLKASVRLRKVARDLGVER